MEFVKELLYRISFNSWKAWQGRPIIYRGGTDNKNTHKKRNINDLLSSCQLSTRNLRRWLYHWRSRCWYYELQVANKYVRR